MYEQSLPSIPHSPPADTIIARMANRFFKYVAAAFNAKPKGMFIPPNWVALAAIGLLSTLFPAVLLVGAGLELAYLFSLINSPRFRRYVDSRLDGHARQEWEDKIDRLVQALDHASQLRYRSLEQHCRRMVADPALGETAATRRSLSEALGQLTWVYLQLLVTRQASVRLVEEGQGGIRRHVEPLAERRAELVQRLEREGLDSDLRRSLQGQVDLLDQRIASQREARQKIEFIDAELARVEEQVNLVREQAVLAADPDAASRRIDAIQMTLGGTTQWIRDQRRLSGELADALEGTPPPVLEVERG